MRVKCATLALLLLGSCGTEAKTLEEAISAYEQNRIAAAEAGFQRVGSDPAAKPEEKATAYRQLSRIAWLLDGNIHRALAYLHKADRANAARCENGLLRARVLNESDRDADLLKQAQQLAARCDDPEKADSIRLRAAQSAGDLAVREGPSGVGHLATAQAILHQIGDDKKTSVEGAAFRLRLALLRRNAPEAVQGWMDYFWLTDTDLPQGLRGTTSGARLLFTTSLAPDAPLQGQLALVDLLIRTGFAQSAQEFAASADLGREAAGHPLWKKASAYFDGRKALEMTILASNRSVARGGTASDLGAAVERLTAKLMAASGQSADPRSALRRAYGLHWTVGETDGYHSVHMGHVVQSERRLIDQYGNRAEVGFLALDNMISNGFNSWLWDGRAAAGGWTEPDQTIVQVRQGYTSGPLNAWELHRGGPARQRIVEEQKKLAANDIKVLQGGIIRYLPGLSDRLGIQVADQVGRRVRASAADEQLRRAFLNEYWRATFQSSILAHEGRHALDRKLVTGLARLRDSNLEYRAKLSEIALADYPRLALANINDHTIGSGNAHGKANERVLRAYEKWIVANSARVRGFDAQLPALVQIDRLTDEQMRGIARSLDPIARTKAPATANSRNGSEQQHSPGFRNG